ncbi:18359_t:CDS:2 [Dentiscutata erythropus]|uniref:18359_t:CDS:1 n=1 Tax=Dentiscutata erythropus TaxID=1348616 RepID=A0A9N9BNS4_9GLOM|nr:18359_t:CDS:2 [Dentiscutata erythropus]
MSKRSKTNIILLSSGTLVYSLHYGPFSRYWWYSTTIENKIQLVPIRLGMTISIFLNSQEFIMRIVQEHSNHSQQPGYYCQAGKFFSNIEESCSAALTSLYQQIFQNNRKLSGPLELGLDDENIINQLLDGVLFQPFLVSFNKFQIFIYSLDNQTNLTFASSLVYIYHKKKCLFVQTREKTLYKIEIFDGSMLIATFEGKSTIEVWQKIGILQKLDSSALFELNDDYTKKQLELHELPTLHLNPERMRLSEIRNELMQRNILFDENCDRTELKTLLQQTLDAEKNSELLPPNQNSISLPNPSIQYTNTIEEQYPLPKGWAIKGKQKFGKKGGAHISKEVADLLKGYFHAGNANSSQRYQPEDMLRALNKKADNNELDRTQIPKLETIRNWISRYSIVIKKEIAEKMLTSLNNNSEK